MTVKNNSGSGPLKKTLGFQIAPFRGVRYSSNGVEGGADLKSATSPPYDVISPQEHGRLLESSPYNITRLTLGLDPSDGASYQERGELLRKWLREGVLVADRRPRLYVYTIDYSLPTDAGVSGDGARTRFLGLMALGKLHPFSDGIILPHEKTFPKVVDDRYRLLDATRANLESIFLLYSDPEKEIDGILQERTRKEPLVSVEAKPGEVHALYRISDLAVFVRLMELFSSQRPIIADGHHRYTTSLRYWREGPSGADAEKVPGAGWQMMTLANLYGDGLSILATHRLVKLTHVDEALEVLLSKFELLADDGSAEHDLVLETREKKYRVRFPEALKVSRSAAGQTTYGLLHDVVLTEWIGKFLDTDGVRYFKEGTGEVEALGSGEGDLLFRMRPVDAREFQGVVEGGEVFPHKTTYFYPKLWSGLVLWPLEEPERPALK